MRTTKDGLTHQFGGDAGGLPRRDALKAVAMLAAAPLAGQTGGMAQPDAAGPPRPSEQRRDQSFDEGWRFLRGDAPGAERPDFNDAAWRTLDLPHDFSVEDLPPRAADANGEGTLCGERPCSPPGSVRSTPNSARADATPAGSWAARAGIASASRRLPCRPTARSRSSSTAST